VSLRASTSRSYAAHVRSYLVPYLGGILLAAGTDLKVVQDQLGHSAIVLTADTYTSVLLETARTAAEHTAALLFPAHSRPAKTVKPAAWQARKPPLRRHPTGPAPGDGQTGRRFPARLPTGMTCRRCSRRNRSARHCAS
jgi:hypothetical protein